MKNLMRDISELESEISELMEDYDQVPKIQRYAVLLLISEKIEEIKKLLQE